MTAASDRPPALVPPGPRGRFLLGNIPDLNQDPLNYYPALRRQYGDFVRMHGLGSFSFFMLFHPDDIEHVLKGKNYPKGMAIQSLRVLVGNGLLTSDGEFWRTQRRLAQPAFHRQRLAGWATMMTDASERLAERLRPYAETGRPVDIAHEMMRLTLEIVGKALFSSDVSGSADALGPAVTDAIEYVNHRSATPFALPVGFPTPRNRRFLRARTQIDSVVYGMIEQRRRTGEDTGDLLSLLLAARDEETGQGMTSEQLRDEVITVFLAGHETTAVTLSWAWYLLAQHPAVEARLHAELAAVLGGRTPQLEDLPRLPYTRMVIDETLRLYPAAWTIARQATADDTIRGYTIPARSVMVMSQYVTHRHPDFWDNPEVFDPERFTPERSAQRHRYAYFPFGGGPRVCIGNSFATMEAQLLLATLAQRYRYSLVPSHRVVPEPSVTLRPRDGVLMTLLERSVPTVEATGTGTTLATEQLQPRTTSSSR